MMIDTRVARPCLLSASHSAGNFDSFQNPPILRLHSLAIAINSNFDILNLHLPFPSPEKEKVEHTYTSSKLRRYGATMQLLHIAYPLILALQLSITHASVLPASHLQSPSSPTPLPLLIWHGLGDTYDAPGLSETAALAARTNPGTDVYIIRLSNSSSSDRRSTFFGNVTTQVESVCSTIRSHPLLSKAAAVNALGFSQGGQFLRGFVERCNYPPVRNLVTFGSQHNGIHQFQDCKTGDWLCKSVEGLLGANTWSALAQSTLVPAQYFRDGEDLDTYLESSNYLADINNERTKKNETYARNIAALERFVMYIFDKDVTVVPKESGWFAEVNSTTGRVEHLRERDLYKEDWLGLKVLDEKKGLVFRNVSGAHMQLTDKMLKEAFESYFTPKRASVSDMAQEVLAESQTVLSEVVARIQDLWIDL